MSRSDEPSADEITAGVQKTKIHGMSNEDLARVLHSLSKDYVKSGNVSKAVAIYRIKALILEEAINRLLPDAVPSVEWTDEEWLWSMHNYAPEMHAAIIGTAIAQRRKNNVT